MRISNGAGGEQTPRPDLQAVLRHYGSYVEHDGVHLCVVHDEDRPSMSVDLDKQLVQCFSCGFAGDAFSIIMKKENIDFKRAVESAAQFESAASDRGGDDVQSVLGRKRSGLSRDKGDRRSAGGGRAWRRPW